MKLRNKKTGKSYIVHIGTSEIGNIHLAADDYIAKQVLVYETLAELNEEWEDYKPVEPLIKDEKVRKAIRTWAAAANVKTDKIRVSKGTFFTSFIGWIDGLVGGLEISFRTGDAFEAINDGAEVTMAELCGEDEE